MLQLYACDFLNTSGNDALKRFVESMETMTDRKMLTRTEMEQLVSGEEVQKEIRQELTYPELYSSPDNIWSALFMTGYLTWRGEPDGNRYRLVIPSREIREFCKVLLEKEQ